MEQDIIEDLIYSDIRVKEGDGVRFKLLSGERSAPIDIFEEPYRRMHSRSPYDSAKEKILQLEKEGLDPFNDIVGKEEEKEAIKTSLSSEARILLIGERGYGKTTLVKSVYKLLPDKIFAIRGCKIYDDPTRPVDYACKYKIMRALEGGEEVELVEIPPPFIRLPGDPQLTSRQLIGGISIQRVREGYDLDHPEVFLPGRALKGNRGLIYIDELGAIPSVLQTLLHELFEEKQVTTTEGDIVPFKIDTIVIASTNPANYRGTNPIKEPLLDRMEKIQVNPPKSLEEEVEIGLRNMYVVKEKGQKPNMPYWHLEIGALAIRSLRRSAETGPSCRATIKLYDHLKSVAIRKGRQIPLLIDYGKSYGVAKLALLGRVEFPEESPRSVGERIEEIVEKSIDEICKQVYARIPSDKFGDFYEELRRVCEDRAVVDLELVSHLKKSSLVDSVVNNLLKEDKYGAVDEDLLKNEECYLACAEMLLESLARCLPACVEKRGNAYLLHELKTCAEERARPAREEDIVQFHGTESWPPVPA